MKKNKTVKVMAFLALLWIIISIIWTALLILSSPKPEVQQSPISVEELQKIIDENKSKIQTWTWDVK